MRLSMIFGLTKKINIYTYTAQGIQLNADSLYPADAHACFLAYPDADADPD